MSEITLLLHPVTVRKMRETLDEHTLSYDQILERLFSHEQFSSLSEQLAAIPASRNVYYPNEAIAVDVTFDTQFSAQSLLCHQLLTSFAIASCYYANLWSLLLQSDIEAAMRDSGLEFRLTRRASNYAQTLPNA
jgi:hypothetical protein